MKGVVLLMLASMGFGATAVLVLTKPPVFIAMLNFLLRLV
jgi:hypothetical protein